MQGNTAPDYRGTYLSQPFDVVSTYPESFDEFTESRIGQVRIADIPTRIKEKQLKIWGGILNLDGLTTPLSDSIKVAKGLYILVPQVNAQPGGLQLKANMQHALVRLTYLWKKFAVILRSWAKTEVGAQAEAGDGLARLEEARFLPVLARFIVALQEYGEPGLFQEVAEFVATSVKLGQQIEFWLKAQNV